MMKKVLASILIATLGCTTAPKYVEGTMTQVGAYLPFEGNIYGMEVINYLNGCKVTSVSNTPFTVDRTYTSTNNYLWGMVITTEHTHTKVEMLNELGKTN